MRTGLIVGKFYPPHRGHKFHIEFARGQVDRLIILLCHHRDQHIPGVVRLQWLNEIHPDCDVHLVDDTLPENHQAWAAFVRAYFGKYPDIVFSSEAYGDPFAAAMGAQHVMVDGPRAWVPVSGSAIRRDPMGQWEFLEPCVRAWFVPRVVVVGAESTGKTTLAADLAREFNTVWVPEYGREYCEIHGKFAGSQDQGDSAGWSSEEFDVIATIQQANENRLAREANKLLVCDTNAFVTGTWHERYFGFRSESVDWIGAQDKVDQYLLCRPDTPFVQDGTRDGLSVRDWMHSRFREQLERGSTPFVEIQGSWEERFAQASKAISEITSQRT